jgi:dienelactone hydrolase
VIVVMANVVEQRRHGGGLIERLEYYSDDGLRLMCWIMRPVSSKPAPVLVFNHGSQIYPDGTDLSEVPTVDIASACWPGVDTGDHIICCPEGRGYGGSEGTKLSAALHSTLDTIDYLRSRARDAAIIVEWVRRQPYARQDKVGLWGPSHGGVVSLFCMGLVQCCAVVAQCPGVFYGDENAGVDEMTLCLLATTAPVLIQHAANDTLISVKVSRKLYARAGSVRFGVSYKEYPGLPNIEGHLLFMPEHYDVWGANYEAGLEPLYA